MERLLIYIQCGGWNYSKYLHQQMWVFCKLPFRSPAGSFEKTTQNVYASVNVKCKFQL